MLGIDLSGITALITGGSGGIGSACAEAFLKAEASVVTVDLQDRPSDDPGHNHIVGDVRDVAVRRRALAAIGNGPSTLVNNAALQIEKRLDETSADEIRRIFDINITSVVEFTQSYARVARDGSSIVNMGSVLGISGDPALAAYSVTKGAIANFTRTAALEYAGRIRVNAVLPGAIRTPLTTRAWGTASDPSLAERRMTAIYPVGRIGEPQDVSGVVAFLASPLASFITGSLFTVDGGLLAANAEWGLERL